MIDDRIVPEKTCLLFFDFLNGHIKKGGAVADERYETVIANAQKLLKAARATGMMVAYAYANHRPDNATTFRPKRDTNNRLQPVQERDEYQPGKPIVSGGTWETEVIDELKPEPQDYMIPKFRWSAFYQTYLDLALRTRGIDTLMISGGSTDVGVASTAFAARDMDYHIVVARDACTSKEQDNHDQLMNRMFPRMGRVRATDEIISMIGANTGTKL